MGMLAFGSKCDVLQILGGDYIQLVAIRRPSRRVAGPSPRSTYGTAERLRPSRWQAARSRQHGCADGQPAGGLGPREQRGWLGAVANA